MWGRRDGPGDSPTSMKPSTARWFALILIGVFEILLVSQLPQVLTHHSDPDRHHVLYMSKSPAYWLFMVVYVWSCVVGAVVCVLLLTKRSGTWLSRVTGFFSKRRTFSWSEVIGVAVSTLLILCVPEIAARAIFITRYSAPATLLAPYLDRFDQNWAVYGQTLRSPGAAQGDLMAFRQAYFEYRPYVGFSPVLGFKPAPRPVKNAFRVFFLGGSAMEHSAAPTIRDVRQRFQQDRCDVEIINAGRSAYVSGQELVMTVMEVVQLQPDLIILFHGYNDLARVEQGEAPGTPEYTRAMAATFNAHMGAYQYLLADVAQRSFLIQLLKPRPAEPRSAFSDEDRLFRDAVDIYGANVEKMGRVAKSYGYGLVVTVQPIVFFRDPLGPTEAKFTEDRQRTQRYRDHYQELIQRAATGTRAEGVYMRDLARVFSSISGDVFYDTVHFDSENAAVRGALSTEFVDIIRSYPTFRCGRAR
jgi:hypothetical protein